MTDTSAVKNGYVNNMVNNSLFQIGGIAVDGMQLISGTNGFNLSAVGPDTNINWVLNSKGLGNTDYTFRDGLQRTIMIMADSQSVSDNIGTQVRAGRSTISASFGSQTGGNMLVGGSGAASTTSGSLATTATSGLMQIPYMAGKPTGTPTTLGGASLVFDTTDLMLCAYSPAASAWKCTAAMN